ncbi:MAG: RIP metalloprotease RseP [Legionellales bacterium RIFCSPHIGHO2_12_FULL_42_9]|nr:MAG: RIP metalloprotease RseP [Legionellales bacterium RIFCSPHIGHO2_12_FULL_42_9]
MLLTLFYFFLALFLLVTIHEYGHFLVARLCGVKVLRFSFGFGKALFRWHDKRGTEYVFSALPLGGYVKMLDEGEGSVALDERHLAFNNKSVYARIAIVLAGPLFNFIFAFVAFWLVLVIGVLSLAPIIDAVRPNSIAERAGLSAKQEIVAFNQQPINSWHDFQYELIPKLGSHETILIRVKSILNNQQKTISLPLKNWQPDLQENPLLSLGIIPFIPMIPPIVGDVMKDSVAKQAGFLTHDVIVAANGEPIHNWLNFVHLVKKSPSAKLVIKIKRKSHFKTITLTTASQQIDGKTEGYIGLRAQQIQFPKKWLHFDRQSPIKAAGTALRQTVKLTSATFVMIGRLLTGQLGLTNLSGPIGIAQGAGNSARAGLTTYLSFLGFISVSLGVLNLLPIPILDGGHFVYHLIELIRRRPLSEKSKAMGFSMGFIFIVMLMIMVVFNDFSRLLR